MDRLLACFKPVLDATSAALIKLGGFAVLLLNPRKAAILLWKKQHSTLGSARGSEGVG